MLIIIFCVFLVILLVLCSLMVIKNIRKLVKAKLIDIKDKTLYSGLIRTFQVSFM